MLEQPCFSGRTAELASSFTLHCTPLLNSRNPCLATASYGTKFELPAPHSSFGRCQLEAPTCSNRSLPHVSRWSLKGWRPESSRHVRCQAKRKGGEELVVNPQFEFH